MCAVLIGGEFIHLGVEIARNPLWPRPKAEEKLINFIASYLAF